VIHYAKHAVQLTNANKTKVEFVATPSTRTSVILNTTKAIPMEEIRVVHDFPDVFPEDLPDMPPDHDIEFIIDLVPGTPPISKRLHQMPANKLELVWYSSSRCFSSDFSIFLVKSYQIHF
jgi:hypothetical protein